MNNAINYEKFEKALDNLRLKYEYYLKKKNSLNNIEKEIYRVSLIQCFEVCFDTAWKHLKKYLELQGLDDFEKTPKGTLRQAHKSNVIENIDTWILYVNKRNATSHNYNVASADEIIGILADFIEDANNVLGSIHNE